jgi:hypothetical protein
MPLYTRPPSALAGTCASLLVPLLALAAPALAQNIPITNPGFEAFEAPPGAFILQVPAGWTLWDPAGRVDQVSDAVGLIRPLPGTEYFPAGTPEGNQAALIFLGGGSGGGAVGLHQTLTTALQPLTRYTLSVGVGNIASGTSLPGSADGGGTFYDLSGFPGYRIELYAGDTLLASDANSLGATIPEGAFRTSTLSFESGALSPLLGQALGIRLVNLDLPGIEVDFDNVQLVATPVPEPSVAWLLAVGGVWVGWHVRRRAQRAVG